MALTLIIGNKNYSSWTLRSRLAGRFGILDAMYAPGVFHFHGYWLAAGQVETGIIQAFEE